MKCQGYTIYGDQCKRNNLITKYCTQHFDQCLNGMRHTCGNKVLKLTRAGYPETRLYKCVKCGIVMTEKCLPKNKGILTNALKFGKIEEEEL